MRIYLDKDAKIEFEDVFCVTLTLPDGTKYEHAELRRLFPVSNKDHYISVIDKDEHEIAMIRNLDDLNAESKAVVKTCFNDYYMIPKITKINSLTDKSGALIADVITDRGPVSFRIRNWLHDMKMFDDGRVIIRDSNDNRYEIEHFDSLDKKSKLLLLEWV